jgi:hypothetical protein
MKKLLVVCMVITLVISLSAFSCDSEPSDDVSDDSLQSRFFQMLFGKGGGNPTTWTAVSNSTFGTNRIEAITYGNGKFVAGDYDGRMAYSSDGISWTAIPSGTGAGTSTFGTSRIRAVAYGAGKFVALGDSDKMAYSADGISWTAGSTKSLFSDTFGCNSIAWGGDKFVAGGGDGQMAYSSDGISWTAVLDSTFGTTDIRGIAYGGGRFIAVSWSGKVAYSDNGTSWTAVSSSTFTGDTDYTNNDYINGVAYGANKFVAAMRYRIAYSNNNGTSWTMVSSHPFGRDNPRTDYSDFYAIAWSGSRFVIVGDSGTGANYTGRRAYSADGISWTAISSHPFNVSNEDMINAIAYGNGKFVAVGANGKIAYSN